LGRPRLTLNLGIRYDLFTRHKERFDRETTFLLGPGDSIPAGPIFLDGVLNANIPAGSPGCDTPEQVTQVVLAGVCGPGGFARANALGSGDHNNFGPRVGVAWDIFGNGKTALRAGFGISYEGTLFNPQSNSRWNPPFFSLNEALNWLLPVQGSDNNVVYGPQDGSAVRLDGANTNPGAPVGGVGNIAGWDPDAPNLALVTGIVFSEGFEDPWVANWHVGLQHEVLPETVLEVNYVATRGHSLFRAEDINRVPGLLLPAGMQAQVQGRTLTGFDRARLNPNYGTLRVWENVGRSWYNALQVSLRKRMSHGLLFNLNYKWSHSIDIGSTWHQAATTANRDAAGDGFTLDPTRPEVDRGNSIFDIRHRLVVNFVYDLPFFSKRQGFAAKILGGWQINGIVSAQTGAHWTPFTREVARLFCADATDFSTCVNTGGDFNLDNLRNDRPDVGPGGTDFNATKDMWANGWFNSPDSPFDSALGGASPFFATPCVACNGNFPRNALEGPGQLNFDFSLFKNITVKEEMRLQFRFEAFNLFNRTNFLLPNFNNEINGRNFGQAAFTLSPRQIQFGIKFLW
jgi:hypothetical protein